MGMTVTGTGAADFTFTKTCGAGLAIGANCTISVTFKPTYPGLRTANLAISSNDPTNPILNVGLTGTSPKAPVTITASSITINWGAPVPTITPTATGLVSGDTVASLVPPLACTTVYTITSAPGTYNSSCSGAVSTAYTFTYRTGRVTVSQAAATMISPAAGSVLGTSATFTWNTGGALVHYQLWASQSGPGQNNLFLQGSTTALTATINNIPQNGKPVYVRLWTSVNGQNWTLYNDYIYTATAPIAAAITSPAPGSVLPIGNATFTWTAGTGVTSYQLWVSQSGPGLNNLFLQGPTAALSANVTGLPANGKTTYVRLWTSTNGQNWTTFTDYTYTAAPPIVAALVSPTPGSLLPASTTFTWTAGSGVTSYQLWVSSIAPGRSELLLQGPTTALTTTAIGLPTNGSTIYVRLYTQINGVWTFIDYTYL